MRKRFLTAALTVCCLVLRSTPAQRVTRDPPPPDAFTAKPRLFVLSDIGNEPDDQMSLLRLLLYSNEIEIEGLVATTSTWQRSATHPETMHELVQAYGEVLPHLRLHAAGWPDAGTLEKRIFVGQSGYGIADTGPRASSPGAEALIRAVDREDSRPLWVALWSGANTLAQALLEVRSTRSPEAVARFVGKLRVSSISDQDDAGPWIRREFPSLFYVVQPSSPDGKQYAYATWTGISGDVYYRNGEGADSSLVTDAWLDRNIRAKTPYGAHYPHFLFIMEGDTPSFLNLIGNGLNAFERPDWGGWGGRYMFLQPYGEQGPIWTQGGDLFTRITSQDTVQGIDGHSHTSDQATVWRWREAFQNDFAARMDWTREDFAHANHAPEIRVNGNATRETVTLAAQVGRPLKLDAAGSHDPDRGQSLRYHWFVYREAGASGEHRAKVRLQGADGPQLTVIPESACSPLWLPLVPCRGEGEVHVILAVTDDGTPRLTSYRRFRIQVQPERAETTPSGPVDR